MASASTVIPWLYLMVPVAAMTVAAARARRAGALGPIRELVICCAGGAVAGLLLAAIYAMEAREGRGRVPTSQIAITCYWGIVAVYVLRTCNAILTWVFARLTPAGADGRACCPAAEAAAIVARSLALLAIGIPYVAAMMLIYRPHVVHAGTPTTLLGVPYEDVKFASTDGIDLRAWWIPAARTSRTDDAHPAEAWGERTVILCHGFGADKASQLRLARDLVPNGYNVLAFDFRAHGQSGGQFTTFGDLERRDVLGAVRWVRQKHPDQSHKVFGLGESLGAAALISAAADPSPEGQAIEALAVFAPYDRLSSLVQGIADDHFAPAAGWLVNHLALPVAGGQIGSRLGHYAPARDVQALWPRPLLVIGSEQDRATDISRSRGLYDNALQPKYGYWIRKGGRDAMLFSNDNASLGVRIFFEESHAIL